MDNWNSSSSFPIALYNLRFELKEWNKNSFGDIFCHNKKVLARLAGIQRALQTSSNSFLVRLEAELL